MAFVRLGTEYIKEGYTQLDNMFLLGYLPGADAVDVKIYLYGLTLAGLPQDGENQLEKMALSLQLSEERILEGFRYWEKKGLVSVSKTAPPAVSYLSVKQPLTPVVKLNAAKYASFVEEVERLFPNKIFNQNEYSMLMELIETGKLEINAMLLIMQYCSDLKGGSVTVPYILAVAANWIKQGLLTERQVDDHIAELENNSEALRSIFKALGIKRGADLEDRQLYVKWSSQYKYTLDAVLTAAKSLKRKGGMERLDALIFELHGANALTAAEVAEYVKGKEKLHELAINVTKNLGAYYGDTDIIIETYINGWLNSGFEQGALVKLSKFCFYRGIKNYEGLDQMVAFFRKMGLLTEAAIDAYVEGQLETDKKIKEIFLACGYFGAVTVKDRNNYRMWTEWGFDDEIIIAAAQKYNGATFPLQSIARALSSLHTKGIKNLEDANRELENTVSAPQSKKDTFIQHEYSEEQIKSVLIDFDDWN